MRLVMLLVATLLAMAASMSTARAAEDYDGCTHFIESTPTTIGEGGTWCLDHDLVLGPMEDVPIMITVPNVTIDCNHFAVDGSVFAADTGVPGILSWETATNATVRNCDIRGFMLAISLEGGGTVEDNLLQGARAWGIVMGKSGIVRRNRLRDIGNSTSNIKWALGIVANGDMEIIDNDIAGLTATPGSNERAIGILVNDLSDTVPGRSYISGNRISGLSADGTSQAIAINVNNEGGVAIVDNVLFGNGEYDTLGIYCIYEPDSAVRGNILFDFGYPVWGCLLDIDNSVKP